MSFFGIGPLEILVILAVALVIFGPGKLPEIAQTAARGVREFRAATNDLTGEFQRTLNEVTSLTDDVKQTAVDVQQSAHSAINGMQTVANGVRLDQANIPVTTPGAAVPPPPPPTFFVPGASPRMPTKADPLADLMPADYSPPVATDGPSQPGSDGATSA